jgi:hypothetical protein
MVGKRPDPYQLLNDKIRTLHGLRADRLGLLMTVGEHNVGKLTEALIAFQRDGFRSVSFSFMQEVEPGTGCATPEALTAAMVDLCRAIVDGRLDRLACMTLIQWIMRIAIGRSGFVCLGSPCGAGSSVATVLADGEVGPCDSIYSNDFFHSAELSRDIEPRRRPVLLCQVRRGHSVRQPCRDRRAAHPDRRGRGAVRVELAQEVDARRSLARQPDLPRR